MALTMRPGRALRRIAKINEADMHIQHHRSYLQAERFESQNREWNRPPIPITLGGPWKNREPVKILKAWGAPSSHEELEVFVHFREGGWGVFELPSMPDVYAFVAKARKHADAVTYLELLCKIALIGKKYRVEKINMEGLKPPYMLLSNHMYFIDFMLCAMGTSRMKHFIQKDYTFTPESMSIHS